ncbi:hypothetical protein KSF_112430 [Reticulibacter mediterranei]|uniref:Uncharacterized protein n=1 Tax=Reticulibacter mediterranei TaxID=2778369 RepID=A0A8J3IZ70_9CHLR|nr:hypothetical protein KSF_112430 [Reticulibacter mediterranei]
MDSGGEEDSQNRPFSAASGSVFSSAARHLCEHEVPSQRISKLISKSESQKGRLLTENLRQTEEIMKIEYVRVSKQEENEAL